MTEEDDAVSQIFNDLQSAIFAKPHPSQTRKTKSSDKNHCCCALCGDQFYTRSSTNDINSFFQKHLNTSYHKGCCEMYPCPDGVPVFTWQEEWVTGRCNVCDMSDLNAYFKDSPMKSPLFPRHVCFWEKKYKTERNEDILGKMSLLKKYCSLPVFQEKFIKTFDEKTACVLCGVRLTGNKEKFGYHLTTDDHYLLFVGLVESFLRHTAKDLLNGFVLEAVTRWILKKEFPFGTEDMPEVNEEEKCFKESNSQPVADKAEQIKKCLESQKSSSDDKSKKLQLPPNAALVDFFVERYRRQCQLVERVFTVRNGHKDFCEVCEHGVPKKEKAREFHLKSKLHLDNSFWWEDNRENLMNGRLFGAFGRIGNGALCVLCGKIFPLLNLFQHLRSWTHSRNANRLALISYPETAPAVMKIDEETFACHCTICNAVIHEGGGSPLKLKKALDKATHWPCSKGTVRDAEKVTKDLERVERTVEAIGDLLQVKITGKVEEKLQILLNSLESRTEKGFPKTETPDSGSREEKSIPEAEEQDPGKENRPNVPKSEISPKNVPAVPTSLGLVKTESSPNGTKEETAKNERDDKTENKNFEVLTVTGFKWRKIDFNIKTFLKRYFHKYGRVRSINLANGQIMIRFWQKGVARLAAAGPPIEVGGKKLDMVVSLKEEKNATRAQLHQDIAYLLARPFELVKLVDQWSYTSMVSCESPEEIEKERLVCKTIIDAVFEKFPRCRCYPFGSRVAGLQVNRSDLDVFLDYAGNYDGVMRQPREFGKTLVSEIERLLRRTKTISNITVVKRARVPIVSFLHLPTQLNCDVSFKNGLSVENTLLIRYMISLDSRVRPMILFLKNWASLNCIHGPAYFSSYAITMLVFYFLQQLSSPVLPTIESLKTSFTGHRKTIAGWDCSFNLNRRNPKTNNTDSIPKLLEGFFSFYAGFDYAKEVVSPLTGQPLTRAALMGKAELPMAYKRHIINLPLNSLIDDTMALCVLDPIDLSHVLTKSFNNFSRDLFVHLCRISSDLLKQSLRFEKE